jgi:hypothetical protein
MRSWILCASLMLGLAAMIGCTSGTGGGGGEAANRIFFLHHSVGQGIVAAGIRDWVADYNTAHSTTFEFWDHGYQADGLFNAQGESTGTSYGPPTDNTDPDGLLALWTGSGADERNAREEILANYRVIAFKPCFTAIASLDAPTLATYESAYLSMRNVFDQHTDRIFVVISPPPNAFSATDAASAQNARDLATWLASGTFLSGHPNVLNFNLFDVLANPDDGGAEENLLRTEYLGDATGQDSHPNAEGYAAVAPALAEFLVDAAGS